VETTDVSNFFLLYAQTDKNAAKSALTLFSIIPSVSRPCEQTTIARWTIFLFGCVSWLYGYLVAVNDFSDADIYLR